MFFFFLFPLGSHSPAGPSAGLGAGVRGAGAAERGLKASQALQRPTRACTPPPVPAEKSSSYPRLHRSAFLFQSAGRLAAPPVSGQASCLERAPLHLLARLLAPLPGRARQLEAGGGSLRDPACSRSLCSIPAVSCLLLLSCVFPTLPCRHWCVSECMRRFCFFFLYCSAFATLKLKRSGGEGGVTKMKKKINKNAPRFATHQNTGGSTPPRSISMPREGLPGFRASLSLFSMTPPSSTALGSEELEQKVLPWVVGDCQWELGRF